MYTFSVFVSGLTLLATAALAIPVEGRSNSCINYGQAKIVANDFAQLISNYSVALADAIIADGYTDQSDSVNTLIDSGTESPIPLGALTFASKQAFLTGQGSQPNVPFTILDLWYTCDTVIIRWVSKQTPQQVQGISVLTVQPGPRGSGTPWQIKTTYAEFNSGAWLADLGRPECSS